MVGPGPGHARVSHFTEPRRGQAERTGRHGPSDGWQLPPEHRAELAPITLERAWRISHGAKPGSIHPPQSGFQVNGLGAMGVLVP